MHISCFSQLPATKICRWLSNANEWAAEIIVNALLNEALIDSDLRNAIESTTPNGGHDVPFIEINDEEDNDNEY